MPAGDAARPVGRALETPLLLKLQGWGSSSSTFFVLWFPLKWLVEPGRTSSRSKRSSTGRSHAAVETQLFTEENQLGVGCVRCHGNELNGGVINALDADGNPTSRTRRT